MIEKKTIRPYRIKHKASGLYYQPVVARSNLGKRGKVYSGKRCVLDGRNTHILIMVDTVTWMYEKLRLLYNNLSDTHHWAIYRISKTEFEKEELVIYGGVT